MFVSIPTFFIGVLSVTSYCREEEAFELKDRGKGARCDVVINSDTNKKGTISSPSYPSHYPPQTTCVYEFQGKGQEKIQIIFQDFNLYHSTGDSSRCDHEDSVAVFVNSDNKYEKVASFCGISVPKPVMSNGPGLKLEFRSLFASRYSRGFKALYNFTENFGIRSGRQLSNYPCGFVFNSNETKTGVFHSPNFPGLYPRNAECHYLFYGSSREKVHLHFNYFDVEGVLPCEASSASDHVEFSNSLSSDPKDLRYCGQLKEFDLESENTFFRVTFRSNDRLDGAGYNATYTFINKKVASKMEQSNGSCAIGKIIQNNQTITILMLLVIYVHS